MCAPRAARRATTVRATSSPKPLAAAPRPASDCRVHLAQPSPRWIEALPACRALPRGEIRAADSEVSLGRSWLRLHNTENSGHKIVPLRVLLKLLFPPRRGQSVDAHSAVVFGGFPLCRDPAIELQALQRGVQRTKFNIQGVARGRPNRLGNAIAMHRSEHQRLEHEHIQSSLEQVHIQRVYIQTV